jgi:beta-1,4-mannosyltransferase
MMNHARELARHGYATVLIGLRERPLNPPPGVEVRRLRRWSGFERFGLPGAAVRMSLTLVHLILLLLRTRPKSILIQNPPSFPTLAAAWIAARLSGARLIVDWHNYGFTMLALRTGGSLIAWAERYEGWTGRRAAAHFCVSRAMQSDLSRRFGISAETVYDRPLEIVPQQKTPEEGKLVAVCPAGWTADEDMAMLLDALDRMSPQPTLEIHLTGDGPTREAQLPRIETLRRRGWQIHTGFLAEPEYHELLARADIGISMHRSSSGLDLAMKVVDLQGAAIPVVAFDYGGSLPEQVIDGETGFLFRTAEGLAELLGRLREHPVRVSINTATTVWSEEWDRTAARHFGF